MSILTPEAQISAITGFKAAMLDGEAQGYGHATNSAFIRSSNDTTIACALGLAAISIWAMPEALNHGLEEVIDAYLLNVIDVCVPLPLDLDDSSHNRSIHNLGDGIIHLNDCCKLTVKAIAAYLDATVAVIQSQIA